MSVIERFDCIPNLPQAPDHCRIRSLVHIYNGQRWCEILSASVLKKLLREYYLKTTQAVLENEHHWIAFESDEVTSKKSYRWVREPPTGRTSCLSKLTMIIAYQILAGTLPVKCNNVKNRQRDDTKCLYCHK